MESMIEHSYRIGEMDWEEMECEKDLFRSTPSVWYDREVRESLSELEMERLEKRTNIVAAEAALVVVRID